MAGTQKPRFEGWYFKHSAGGKTFCLIPGLSVGNGGEKTAFLQILSAEGSRFFRFPPEEYRADPAACLIRIGDSVFSRSGLKLSVLQDGERIFGRIGYSALRPIGRSIWNPTLMGPFSYLRFLECSHDIVSLSHELSGFLNVNGKTVDFTGGRGYIESDAGRSFPRAWVWYQSNGFSRPGDCVMLAAAKVPVAGISFPGLLCVCSVGGREYRMATYRGGGLERVERSPGETVLQARQGRLFLEIRVRTGEGRKLLAPSMGSMTRKIREFPCCDSRVRLTSGGRVLLEDTGACAGFELAGNPADLYAARR